VPPRRQADLAGGELCGVSHRRGRE
jgi:hypothetical protein